MNKSLQRFVPIISNGLRSVLIPFISIFFSFIVVHYFSKQLWGDFVEILLFVLVANTFSNWGQKEFVLRAFSKTPKNMVLVWQQFLLVRIPLLIFLIIIAFLFFDASISYSLAIWLPSAFIINSFSPIYIYERDYLKAVLIETLGFIFLILSIFYYQNEIILSLLIQLYTIHVAIKALLFILLYRKFTSLSSFSFKFSLLISGIGFFLMSLTGFLQSKIDVYVFQLFNESVLLGEYQIISGFLLFAQSITMILILPYLKNIYRVTDETILKMKKTISYLGFFLNTIIILFIYFVLKEFYAIELTFLQLGLAFLITYPSYIYSLKILLLFKNHREKVVVKISAICLFINLIISFLLLYFGFSITGVFIANAIAQITSLFVYISKNKSTKYE